RAAKQRGQSTNRRAGRLTVQRKLPAEKVRWVKPAEHQVRVGHGWLQATLPVTDRPRVGTGAHWAHAQRPAPLHPPHGPPPPGADRRQLKSGNLDRYWSAAMEPDPGSWQSVTNNSNVCASAAHVQRDDIVEVGRRGDDAASQHTGCRARENESMRILAHRT